MALEGCSYKDSLLFTIRNLKKLDLLKIALSIKLSALARLNQRMGLRIINKVQLQVHKLLMTP